MSEILFLIVVGVLSWFIGFVPHSLALASQAPPGKQALPGKIDDFQIVRNRPLQIKRVNCGPLDCKSNSLGTIFVRRPRRSAS
jgi:hypothetical protein